MGSQYAQFDTSRLKLKPPAERVHDLDVSHWLRADQALLSFSHPGLLKLADCSLAARPLDIAPWTTAIVFMWLAMTISVCGICCRLSR